MQLARTSIYLRVANAGQSVAFYEALLGVPPTRSNAGTVVFESDAPALLLILETCPGVSSSHARYALVVPEPERIGQTAIALRRAGARLSVQDQGLEVRDPDGNEWRVRLVPFTQTRVVVQTPPEHANEKR